MHQGQSLPIIGFSSGRSISKEGLQVHQGQSLLIIGSSGCGKTSLLRAIAGLWTVGTGTVTRYGAAVAFDSGGGDVRFPSVVCPQPDSFVYPHL